MARQKRSLAVVKTPSTVVIKRNLAQALSKGQLNDAEHLIIQLKGIEPFSLKTRGFELELLIRSKKYSDAKRLVPRLLEDFPNSARIHWLAGQVRYYEKDYSQAVTLFDESLKLKPAAIIRWWLGRALVQQGEIEKGRAELERIVEKLPFAYRDIAWAFERAKDLKSALKAYTKLLDHYPSDDRAKQSIVRLKASLLDPEELIKEMDRLKNWGEDLPTHLLPIYVSRLFELGQGERARGLISEIVMPSELNQRIGWICYQAQAFDLAFVLFRAAIRDGAKDFKLLNAFEQAADKCGRREEGIKTYESLVGDNKTLYGRISRLRRKAPTH